MTAVEKKRKKKKGKKNKKQQNESEVLERVMDSIEMAGASLDFFEEESGEATTEEVVEEPNSEETVEMQADGESEEVEVSGEETTEEQAVEEPSEDLSEAETMEMLPEEQSNVEFIESKQALSILESILFSSERPLGIGTFKQVFKGTNYKTKEIKKALEELQVEYADQSRGVTLEEINGGWQLRTKVDNMDFLRKLAKARPFKLSGPALEVLAIIAYKQPMIKSEVDDIRGVESGHLVRALMEKGLVSFQGKSELPGKPMQYGTTRKFLEIFGLRNLRELPSLDEIDQLLPDGIGIEEEDEKLSDVTAKMAEEFEGSYSEGAEELEAIESTLGGIDTSSEFFEEEKRRQKEKRDRDRAQDIREALDVGEEVDAKDQRWLERYDAKLAEEAEAQTAAEATGDTVAEERTEEGALIEEPESLTDELSMLSEQEVSDIANESLEEDILVSEEVMMADQELDEADDFVEEGRDQEAAEEIDELTQALIDDTEDENI